MTTLNSIAAAFMYSANNRDIEKHEVEGLGEVGLKKLSIGGREDWLRAELSEQPIILIQNTVCDPITGELVLKELTPKQLKELPIPLVEELTKLIFKQNGFKTVAEAQAEKESEELKNLEADQT